ncbi:MAG: hypothetical protein F9K47_05670 [Burkholderiales bacterium]|nr:MAG: hypothetical protein F9K47_05670 [Burkholderiales bacterium]
MLVDTRRSASNRRTEGRAGFLLRMQKLSTKGSRLEYFFPSEKYPTLAPLAAFGGCHLGAVRIGDVGLEFLPLAVGARGMAGEKLPRPRGFLAQRVDARLALGRQDFIGPWFVLSLVQRHDLIGPPTATQIPPLMATSKSPTRP